MGARRAALIFATVSGVRAYRRARPGLLNGGSITISRMARTTVSGDLLGADFPHYSDSWRFVSRSPCGCALQFCVALGSTSAAAPCAPGRAV